MMQRTLEITVTNAFTNLAAAIKAQGYAGGNLLSEAELISENDEDVFIHLTASGESAPAGGDAAKGVRIGNNGASVSRLFRRLDAGLVWLYAANPTTVKVLVQGV